MDTKCSVEQYFSRLNGQLVNFYFGKVGVFSLSPDKSGNPTSCGEEKTDQEQNF